MDYYTAKFCAYLVDNKKLNMQNLSEKETEELKEGIEQLKHFQDYDTFVNYCAGVRVLCHNIKQIILIQQTSSNMVTYNSETNEDLLKNMREIFQIYKKLVESCQNHPEWQDKIKEEIGVNWSLIYASHEYTAELEKMYEESGFDRHYFFK